MAVRDSQITPEALATGDPNARVSQVTPEGLVAGDPNARVSQLPLEALVAGSPNRRVSQFIVEALILNVGSFMPLYYPTLEALSFSVSWKPQFFNMKTQVMATGAQLDVGLSSTPLHDFDLTYEVLRNYSVLGTNDFRTMIGFFGAMQGNLGRFLFVNPDDYGVTNQTIGTTDGVSHTWTLQRTFGQAEYSWTEPVGYVNTTLPFNVYLDGVLQDPASYSVVQSQPVNQILDFSGTPSAGKRISVDMSYAYYCKLPDEATSFEKFMAKLWTLKKITLHSNRMNT